MPVCLPIKIKAKTNNNNDVLEDTIVVNIFFAHQLKEVDIKRYGGDIQILRGGNRVDVYKCSGAMLKHHSEKDLETFEDTLLYSKEQVKITGNRDR